METKITYASETIECHKCGKNNQISFKFCFECGSALFMQLKEIESNEKLLTFELVLEASDALYNFIIFDDSIKKKYYRPLSESVVFSRVEQVLPRNLWADLMHSVEKGYEEKVGLNDITRAYARSTMLRGYTIRLSEELLANKYLQIAKIPKDQVKKDIARVISIINEDTSSDYKLETVVSNPELLLRCYSFFLGHKSGYMEYTFIGSEILGKLFRCYLEDIVGPFVNDCEDILGGELTGKEQHFEEINEDIIWGYCLKLSESLLSF